MANDVYLDPKILRPAEGWVNPIIQGYALSQSLQNQNLERQMKQQQLQQQQQQQQALQQYGKTGDPAAFRGTNPMMEIQLSQHLASLTPKELQGTEKMANYVQKVRSAITSPAQWDKLADQMEAQGWAEKGSLPRNVTPGQLQQILYMPEMIQAHLKSMDKWKPLDRVAAEEGIKQQFRGRTPEQIRKETEIKESIKEKHKTYKPEILVPASGTGPAISYKPGDPIPKGYIPPRGGKSASQSTDEDIGAMVQGIKEGTLAPSMLSKRAVDYNRIMGRAQREGLNLQKAENQYKAAQQAVRSLNNQQATRLKTTGMSVMRTIDEVNELAKQMNLSGFTPLNYAEITAKMKTAGNTPQGQLATRYVTAVNTLKEEFANVAQGGYAPTESVWKLANSQINENYGVKQMGASLGEIKRLIGYRLNAYDEIQHKVMGEQPHQGKGDGTQSFNSMPAANLYTDKTMRDTETGIRYKSDGTNWVPVTE